MDTEINVSTEGILSSLKQIFTDHFQYRKQILKLAKSDLVRTYRGSALGWLWAVIKPSVTIFVYWFAMEMGVRGQGRPIDGYPYFFWLLAGLIPWFYMSEMLTQGTDSVRRYNYLVTKINFPISTIPTFVSISKFMVHIFLVVVTIVIFMIGGHMPDIYYLQLPIYMFLSFWFWTAFALFSSLLASISKDYSNLVKSFLTAILWMSGILYNVDTVTNPIFKQFLMLNPVTYLATGYRNVFVHQVWFWEQPKRLLYFMAWLLLINLLALWAYKKLRKEIPDVL